MSEAPSAGDDQGQDRLVALTIEVEAVARRAWGSRWTPSRRVIAPGRIELLGNHLDYNGGKVLAGAIDRIVLMLGAEGGSRDAIDLSYTDPETGDHIQESLSPAGLTGWSRDTPPKSATDYARGAIAALIEAQVPLRRSWRFALGGNLPVGLGVSSSAALSVGLVLQLASERVEPRETILLAQAAENRAGVGSGTMDQAASVAGGVIRYDAASVTFEQLDPNLGAYAFVVISSGVVHRLGESAYPIRVRETARLLEIAQRELGSSAPLNLAGLTAEQLATLTEADTLDDILIRRGRHVITEAERVEEGYAALRRGDWPAFGALMAASGRSSATDYDVSHPQVEELVADVAEVDGVLGARMMGGGGGGSVLALVRRDAIRTLAASVDAGYFSRHGLTGRPDRFLVCAFAHGARVDTPADVG